MTDRVVIKRDELFTGSVEGELARQRRLRDRRLVQPPPISPLRAFLMSTTFQLPLAGVLATFLAWAIIEPRFDDFTIVGGEVGMVNEDPFEGGDTELGPARVIGVGNVEVVIFPAVVTMEPGVAGEAAFASADAIESGASLEVAGEPIGPDRLVALAVRPATARAAARGAEHVKEGLDFWKAVFFPLTVIAIGFAMVLVEGIATRNWVRMVQRMGLGLLLTVVFALLAFIPAGLVLGAGHWIIEQGERFSTIQEMRAVPFLALTITRSLAWAILAGAAMVGLNLTFSTKMQLRNALIGGLMGGALGGLFFDPIDRFLASGSLFDGAGRSRLVGLLAVGACVGLLVALVDTLAREAWLIVRTGPLAGKAFVLYRSPTVLGSAPSSDVYLFKDAEIDAVHARILRVGNKYDIEDAGSRVGTVVSGQPVRRRRLQSGDQVVLGGTVLEFEERRQGAEG